MRRAAATLAILAAVAVAVAGCGGSGPSRTSLCNELRAHATSQLQAAITSGAKTARNLAIALGEPASDADPRIAISDAAAIYDGDLAKDDKQPQWKKAIADKCLVPRPPSTS
jgi:hypothetical protein